MPYKNPIEFARLQRQQNNPYEQRLWYLLRNRQLDRKKFRRQHPLGKYTADFYCPEAKLDIEIDGEDHFSEQGRKRDQLRDQWMNEQGIRVLRFTGKQIEFEMQSVLDMIKAALQSEP